MLMVLGARPGSSGMQHGRQQVLRCCHGLGVLVADKRDTWWSTSEGSVFETGFDSPVQAAETQHAQGGHGQPQATRHHHQQSAAQPAADMVWHTQSCRAAGSSWKPLLGTCDGGVCCGWQQRRWQGSAGGSAIVI